MELKDYLKLEGRNHPEKYARAIYNKLKLEMISELYFGEITNPEDVREVVRKYNDKWNQIRDLYIQTFGDYDGWGQVIDLCPLYEDWFQEQYASEMYTVDYLRKMDEFYMLNKTINISYEVSETKEFTELGDDIYESE